MISIFEKCRNERYHQTVKFFYHRLQQDEKLTFILNVAKVNILLASQCLMSDKKDEQIEGPVRLLAVEAAQTFDDTLTSTAGLLALAEFQVYDKILEIFDSLTKPKRVHILVLNQLFREADEETYFKFLDTFTKYHKVGMLLATFMSYKGKISINPESIQILRNLVITLIKKGYGGFVRVFLTTLELWPSVDLIFGSELERIVHYLIGKNEKAITLAYYIVESAKIQDAFPPNVFITALARIKMNKKAISLAMTIALENGVYDNSQLNNTLLSFLKLGFANKNNTKKLKLLIKKGLKQYGLNVQGMIELYNAVVDTSNVDYENVDESIVRAQIVDTDINNSMAAFKIIFGVNTSPYSFKEEISIKDFWRIVFDYMLAATKQVFLEDIIEACSVIYETDLKEVCSILKGYKHIGTVQQAESHGYYLYPKTFASKNLCFMHYTLDGQSSIIDDDRRLKVGQQIVFKVVGYNPNSKRINTYVL